MECGVEGIGEAYLLGIFIIGTVLFFLGMGWGYELGNRRE